MSEQDVKSISSVTGTFRTLQPNTADGQAAGKAAPTTGKAAPTTGNSAPVAEVKEPDLEALAAELNIQNQAIGRDLRFKVDMDSGNSVIQVLDRETGEIIREIPPEKAEVSVSVNGNKQLRLYDGQA
jgi:flagellar protein FlaG